MDTQKVIFRRSCFWVLLVICRYILSHHRKNFVNPWHRPGSVLARPWLLTMMPLFTCLREDSDGFSDIMATGMWKPGRGFTPTEGGIPTSQQIGGQSASGFLQPTKLQLQLRFTEDRVHEHQKTSRQSSLTARHRTGTKALPQLAVNASDVFQVL
jgi:hypothetical protein